MDILLVEDNPGDVRLTREAFAEAGVDSTLHVVTTGADALDFLLVRGRGRDREQEQERERGRDRDQDPVPRPDLVLLDLNLPRTDGIQVLQELEADPDLAHLPVLVLTSSSARDDVLESYDNAANAYLTKPDTLDEFVALVRSIEAFWLETVQLPC